MPVRFTYKEVEPDNFGLSTDEILELDDKDLDRRVPLSWYAPYAQGPKRGRRKGQQPTPKSRRFFQERKEKIRKELSKGPRVREQTEETEAQGKKTRIDYGTKDEREYLQKRGYAKLMPTTNTSSEAKPQGKNNKKNKSQRGGGNAAQNTNKAQTGQKRKRDEPGNGKASGERPAKKAKTAA